MNDLSRIGIAISVSMVILTATSLCGAEHRCASPNGELAIIATVDHSVSWSVTYKGATVLEKSPLGLQVDGQWLPGPSPELLKAQTTDIRKEVRPTVPTKSAVLHDHAQQLTLRFAGGIAVEFRAYNTGVAYRYVTDLPGAIEIDSERFELQFATDCRTFFPQEESFQSHFERDYLHLQLADITSDQFCSLPVLLQTESQVYIAVTDADLYDYPATFLAGTGGNALKAVFPKAVLRTEPGAEGPDRNETIVEQAEYLARTNGRRTMPWRVVMISDAIGRLVEDDLVFTLSRPLALTNTSWIKPGKVAWDWWNALNLYDVDFEVGINTQTYKYYIDFASKYGLEYIILDEGWSKTTTNLFEPTAKLDVKELVEYGKSKNVGVILWSLWKPLDQDMRKILDLWADWGVKGIKVDFMQRADQQMVNFYEETAREAAKRKMLVDYHGAFKPSGLRRAYPNVINYEGLRGLENCKWSDAITPQHDVTLPFVRMLAGPMDFTPGAMENAHKDSFSIRFDRPMSIGTRCHQVAMYVIYEAPLQMLADTPSNYLKDPECTAFIAKMPTTWDESKMLDGKPGEYIVMARRHGDRWFVAAMTNESPRELSLRLPFLADGAWQLEYIKDGADAANVATDYQRDTVEFSNDQPLTIQLAPGGGWAGILRQ